MLIHKYILKAADIILNFIVILVLCIVGLYSVYALWDNNQVYLEAENVRNDMLKLKPDIDDADQGPSFEELQKINQDVCAWLTLDGTEVDYPVLQGADNLTYINKDVYGNFALAGSIFLDTRCDRTFEDNYSLIYGHDMSSSKMFGDLKKYKEQEFFEENTTGTLILPERIYRLNIFAVLLISASDKMIFETEKWKSDAGNLLEYIEKNALYLDNDVLETAKKTKDVQVLALSTCSYEFEDARTIVLAIMEPYQSE